MIIFRVLQIVIALLTLFFTGYAIYKSTVGYEQGSYTIAYVVLAVAGVVLSILLHYFIKLVKRNL